MLEILRDSQEPIPANYSDFKVSIGLLFINIFIVVCNLQYWEFIKTLNLVLLLNL